MTLLSLFVLGLVIYVFLLLTRRYDSDIMMGRKIYVCWLLLFAFFAVVRMIIR